MLLSSIVILIFMTQILPSDSSDGVFNEEPCLKEGGVCGEVKFCPQQYRKPGLCPTQQENGVDCCAIIPTDPNDKRCGRKGGECTNQDCGKSIEKGSVCPEGQKCCIWLR